MADLSTVIAFLCLRPRQGLEAVLPVDGGYRCT